MKGFSSGAAKHPGNWWPALGGVLLLIAWASSAVTLRSIDRGKPAGWDQASLLYLPSGKLLKPMAMDLDEGLAAVLWVRGLLYFSDAYLTPQSMLTIRPYRWMGNVLDAVTTLNPRFLEAYEFGGAILSRDKHEWPETRKILERGVKTFPENWQLHLYIAMSYLKVDSNFVAAADAIRPVSLIRDVPDHIRTLAAKFLEKGGEERMAFAFLVDRYLQAKDPMIRDLFLNRLFRFFPRTMGTQDKSTVNQILAVARSDPRAEKTVRTVLYEYLRDELSVGSLRVLEMLKVQKN